MKEEEGHGEGAPCGASVAISDTSVRSIFSRVERRHDHLFDGTKGNDTEHIKVTSMDAAEADNRASNVDSPHLRRLGELQEMTKSFRSASLANKTKNLLLKGKAVGDKGIAGEDRRYLIITFLESEDTRKCLFVNKVTCSIGDLIEKVAKSFAFPAFKKAVRPNGMTLDVCYIDPDPASAETLVADLDRRDMVESLPEMAECIFTAKTSVEMAELSTKIAEAVDREKAEVEAARLEMEKAAATAEEARRQEQLKKEMVDPASVAKNDTFLYVKEGSRPQLVTIAHVHLDDYPNLYFTVKFVASGNEKQTTAQFLRRVQADAVSAAEGGFAITISHGTKTYPLMGVSESMTVASLKVMVQNASGVVPKNQKLIVKGQVLKDTALVSETKLCKGCKVSLMATKK